MVDKMLSNRFDVTNPAVIDNGILRYENHGYKPEIGTNINTAGEIQAHVTSKDTIVHLAGSYLLIYGRLKNTDVLPMLEMTR
jgi:hypothetical protein